MFLLCGVHHFKPIHEVAQNFDVDGNVGGKSFESSDIGLVDFVACLPNEGLRNSITKASV